MCSKQKIRVAIKLITKDLLVIMLFIIIMFLVVSITVLAATKSNVNNTESKIITAKYVAKVSSKIDTRIDKPRISTMQLMITKKETAKGDRAEKLIQKAILKEKIRKKKIAQRKRKKVRKEALLKAWLELLYTQSNLEIMTHLIEGEAGDQSDECQQAVGQVVLNRVRSKNFKQTTIEDVVFAPGQYACILDGNYDRKPSKRAYKNAKAVLTGNTCIKVPENVVYQSQFEQGSGVWKILGTETFCFE